MTIEDKLTTREILNRYYPEEFVKQLEERLKCKVAFRATIPGKDSMYARLYGKNSSFYEVVRQDNKKVIGLYIICKEKYKTAVSYEGRYPGIHEVVLISDLNSNGYFLKSSSTYAGCKEGINFPGISKFFPEGCRYAEARRIKRVPPDEDKLIEMYNKGMSQDAIGKQFGLVMTYTSEIFKKLRQEKKIEPKRHKAILPDKEEVTKRYLQGMTQARIAKELETKALYVSRVLNHLAIEGKLKLRTAEETYRLGLKTLEQKVEAQPKQEDTSQ